MRSGRVIKDISKRIFKNYSDRTVLWTNENSEEVALDDVQKRTVL